MEKNGDPSVAFPPIASAEPWATPPTARLEAVAGASMIVAGLGVAAVSPKRQIHWVLWGFAISCFALAMAALAPANLFWAAVISWGLSGAAFVAGDAPLTALLQSTIPKHQQGRALSLLSTVTMTAGPVGLALASPIGKMIGMRWLFVLVGILAARISLLLLFDCVAAGRAFKEQIVFYSQ